MKKILVLLLVVCLFGCVTMSAISEVPDFALQLNGYVWFQMEPYVQIVFLVGFAAGQCEMSIYLDEPEAWQELEATGLSYQQIAEGITQYYMMTERVDDSILMVFRIVVDVLVDTAVPMRGGV